VIGSRRVYQLRKEDCADSAFQKRRSVILSRRRPAYVGQLRALRYVSQYDASGNLTNVTTALGVLNRTIRYTYNALNRRIQTTFEDNTTQTTLYDELDRRVGEVDQAGIVSLPR